MGNRFISIGSVAFVLAVASLGLGYYNYTQTRSNTMFLRQLYQPAQDGNCYWHSTSAGSAFCDTKPATLGYCFTPYVAAPACIK